MSKKSNVHPDYYKTAGRDRQDDAAATRQARAIAAKPTSRERPDLMSKGPYFRSPEPAAGARQSPPKAPASRSRKRSPAKKR
jgi:hypothetical protein